jgi:hypothetical protein
MALIRALRTSHLGGYIINESLLWSSPTGEFDAFTIGFGG